MSENWRQEWRRQDELDRARNLEILARAEAETDPTRKWLGLMGFLKEDQARLDRKLAYMQMEESFLEERVDCLEGVSD
jgi:hypothetical protein